MEQCGDQMLRVGLAVMESVYNNIEQNFSRMEKLIKQSADRGVELVVFPELSLTGYFPERAAEMAISPDHVLIFRLRRLAQEYGITVLAGYAEKANEKPYISQLVCDPNGNLRTYRKTHLGQREKRFFSAGDTLPIFCGKMPFGIALCYDTHFPEVSTTLALSGASVIFAPHASPCCAGHRKTVWEKYLPARAYDNRIYFACCNQTGTNGAGHSFGGGAVIYTPEGEMLCEDDSGTESLLVASLSISKTKRYRNAHDPHYKKYYLAHRRPELYCTERRMFVE
jgi:predicted amidohydrolase